MKSVGVTCFRIVRPAGKALTFPLAFAEPSPQLPTAVSGLGTGDGRVAMAMLTPATTVNPPNHSNRGIGCLLIGARQTDGRPRELSQFKRRATTTLPLEHERPNASSACSAARAGLTRPGRDPRGDRKSTRLNSSHPSISYA